MAIKKVMIEIGKENDNVSASKDSYGGLVSRSTMSVETVEIKDDAPEDLKDSDVAIFGSGNGRLVILINDVVSRELIRRLGKALVRLYEDDATKEVNLKQ